MTMSNMMEKLIPDSTEDQLCASLPTPNATLLRATLRLSGTTCHSDHSFFFGLQSFMWLAEIISKNKDRAFFSLF